MNTERIKNIIKNWFNRNGEPYEKIDIDFQSEVNETKIYFTTVWNHQTSNKSIRLHESVIELLSADEIDNLLNKFLNNARKEAGHAKGDHEKK